MERYGVHCECSPIQEISRRPKDVCPHVLGDARISILLFVAVLERVPLQMREQIRHERNPPWDLEPGVCKFLVLIVRLRYGRTQKGSRSGHRSATTQPHFYWHGYLGRFSAASFNGVPGFPDHNCAVQFMCMLQQSRKGVFSCRMCVLYRELHQEQRQSR